MTYPDRQIGYLLEKLEKCKKDSDFLKPLTVQWKIRCNGGEYYLVQIDDIAFGLRSDGVLVWKKLEEGDEDS